MRFLIFILLGTIIFGAAFPAFIVGIGIVGIIFFGVAVYLASRQNGGFFKVYTNGSFNNADRRENEETVYYSETRTTVTEEPDIFEEEGEVVELPQDALRKE